MRQTRWPFSQAIFLKARAEADCFSRESVSRATHLPAMRLATGLLFCEMPPPLPSEQEQSLPKISLSWWRARKPCVNSASRERALLHELAERSPNRFGYSDSSLSVIPPGLIGPVG